jgi:hypothetical protein
VTTGDQAAEVRARLALAGEAASRLRKAHASPPVRAGQVFNGGAMPASLPGRFLVHPVTLSGAEVEGGAVTVTASSPRSVVTVFGPGTPPAVGDVLIANRARGWVAEDGGGGGGSGVTNPCHCTWPRVLSYRGSVAQSAAGFYFINQATNAPEPVYTIAYGARPAEIPKELQLLYFNYPGGVNDPYYVTMPDVSWFSTPIPGLSFGSPCNIYFYLWFAQCQAHVMVIDAPYNGAVVPDGTKGAGNLVQLYQQTSCTPFQMKANFIAPVSISGTHGADDINPDTGGGGGMYTNARVGL